MESAPRTRWLWTPVVVYMAFIFGLSSLTTTPDLSGGLDKDLHMLLYGGLGALLTRALAGGLRHRLTLAIAATAVVAAAAYGVSDEVHQWFVPNRQADVLDVAADTIGAAAATAALFAWSRLGRARHRRPV